MLLTIEPGLRLQEVQSRLHCLGVGSLGGGKIVTPYQPFPRGPGATAKSLGDPSR